MRRSQEGVPFTLHPPTIEYALGFTIVLTALVLIACVLVTELAPRSSTARGHPVVRADTLAATAHALGATDVRVAPSTATRVVSAHFYTVPRLLVVRLDTGGERVSGPYERTPRIVGLRRAIVSGRATVVIAVDPSS